MGLIILTAVTWLAYWGSLKSFFVSDDLDGILHFDGKFAGWNYGQIAKWGFHFLFGKDNRANHFFSILLHNANVILLYTFLTHFFPQNICFFTALLFAIHPVNTQSVSWISARGYPLGLLWALISFNLITMMPMTGAPLQSLTLGLGIALYVLLYFASVHAQFALMMTWAVHLLMGNYLLAVIGLGIALVMGLDIVRIIISTRTKVFKEQNLQESTKLHPRKFIVAMKTLWYYTKLCMFPKRMGLYHEFHYHYHKEVEKEDKHFWLGFGLLGLFIWGLISGNFLVKFGITWYLSYIFIFMNWITIHQFVSERYCYIANIGLILLTTYAVMSIYPPAMFILIGLMIMRTWVHLPTYDNDISFYQSNIWNFPNSEVALANLGVTYMKRGMIGAAVDMWLISLNINKEYDVAHYNISSTLKARGDLKKALVHLEKAVVSPQCHFKEVWSKEMVQLKHEISYVDSVNDLRNRLSNVDMDPSRLEEAKGLMKQIENVQHITKRFEEERGKKLTLVQQEESNLKIKMIQIENVKRSLEKTLSTDEMVNMRDMNWNILLVNANNFIKGVSDETAKIKLSEKGREGGTNRTSGGEVQVIQTPPNQKGQDTGGALPQEVK